MKQLFCVLACLALLQNATSQTVTDHRIPRDTSSALVRPQLEEMPVYRIQLRLTTGTENDAGTDDPVYVQMNNGDSKFYLAKGIDNFQQGKTVLYDVLSKNIKKIKHFDFLRIGVSGADGVCLKTIELLVNNCGTPIYSRSFAGTTGACIDNASSSLSPTIEISASQLRASSGWNYEGMRSEMWRPALRISKDWIVSAVEAAIGNQLFQEASDLQWGTVGGTGGNTTLWEGAVETKKVNGHTLHFDLDLEADVTGPNPEVDVDFDLDFRCERGKILFEVRNTRIHTDIIGNIQELLRGRVFNLIKVSIGPIQISPGLLPQTLLGEMLGFSTNLYPDSPSISASCTQILVTKKADILLR
jgi:hypothetical protein